MTPTAKTPKFHNYAVIRRDRPTRGGGGLLTLIHHSLQFVEKPSPFNDQVEATIIHVSIAGEDIDIANVYIPPQSSCAPAFSASLVPLLNDNSFVVGDVNGHNELWSSGANDVRGDK